MNVMANHGRVSHPIEQIAYLLQALISDAGIDAACVYEYHRQTGQLMLTVQAGVLFDAHREPLIGFLKDFTATSPLIHHPQMIPVTLSQPTPFQTVLLFPVVRDDQLSVVLALFTIDKGGCLGDCADHPAVQIIRTLLENHYALARMDQDVATVRSILTTARAISENPSPQHVVNLLRDTLLEAHISTCALLIYGPRREDTPLEYLEIRGTWSRRLDEFGRATGVKLYLKDYPDLLDQLEQHGVITFNVRQIRNRFDPLVRGFIRAERMRSIALIALGTGANRVGVLALGMESRRPFSPHELENYHTVGEFLAISAMAQVLQSQTDRVQQGRAALLEAVTDGVVMVSPGGAGGTVLTVNNRFLNIFGVPERRATGLTLLDLLDLMQLPEGVRDDLRGEWQSTPISDPHIRRGEFHMVHPEGFPVDMEWYTAPVYQDKSVLGRIYIFHDITSERTAQRLRAKFLSSISHELRTPLTSIRGFAEFILESEGERLPDIAREYTEIILTSAKHLNRVFNDMIEITKADAGELKLHKADAHLPDIVIDVVARLQMLYKEKKQKVILELDDDLPIVSVDADRISQVLTNLLTNAIKYSPEKGKITITTQLLDGTSTTPDTVPRDVHLPAILITVKDEGKGLNHEEAEKVFMPFFRTEGAKRAKIEGVGLGLAVTRSIVEVHRGKIWAVPNTKIAGGCFMFTIPTTRA